MLLKLLWNVEESIDNSCKTGSVRPLAVNTIQYSLHRVQFVTSPGLLLTRNFSKIDQNHDHKKCYLFTKEATWCDENLGLVAHWWPAK